MTEHLALLVEDAEEFVVIGTRLLEDEGYTVAVARDGQQAVDLARAKPPELMLLDVCLPIMDGIEVCRRVREFSNAYVIMLTARGAELDRILGLAVGADDYVTKPFSPRELSMRIKAIQRRPRLRFGNSGYLFASMGRLSSTPALERSRLMVDRSA